MAEEYIRMAEGGDTAVLMIHGIAGTPNHFRPFLDLIPEDWSVMNLLLDGHGKGVKEFGASSMDKWKKQASGRLDELLARHRRVLIAAHSMGALFAIQAAVRYPERIAGLFLLNVPMRIHLPPRTLLACLKNAFGLVKETDGSAWAMKQGCGVRLSPYLWKYISWIPRFAELLGEIRKTRTLLPHLAVPTLAFHSRQDELVSNRSCKDLQGHGYIRTVRLENSGHFGYGETDLALLREELTQQIVTMQ